MTTTTRGQRVRNRFSRIPGTVVEEIDRERVEVQYDEWPHLTYAERREDVVHIAPEPRWIAVLRGKRESAA